MKRMLLTVSAISIIAAPAYGQVAAPERHSGDQASEQSRVNQQKSDRGKLEADVRYLADDALEGREAGTTGYALAAGYVAGQYAALGLQPAGNNGTYFQSVPMVSSRLEFGDRAGLDITNAQGAAVLPQSTAGKDYFTFPKRGEALGEVKGDLVFVGHGFAADGYEQDDFAGIDLTGKIAVILLGAPDTLNSEERAHFSSTTAQRLSERGAVGSITLFTPIDEKRFTFDQLAVYLRSTLLAWAKPDGTAFSSAPGIQGSAILDKALSEALFKGQHVSWEDVLRYKSGEAAAVPSFDMGVTARIVGQYAIGVSSSPNVIGMIPGTDPSVAGEYVVVTAHLDHTGMTPTPEEGDDEIFNGAMDNATGIASMIEAARLLRADPGRRPVVFVALTAEEKGLVGSDYFARNPTLGSGKVVANINLDMPILTYEFTDVIAFGAERSTLFPEVQSATASQGITLSPDPVPQEGLFTRSDQYSFVEQGVPSIFLVTGWANGGAEAGEDFLKNHYHQVSDEVSLIDFEQLGRFTDLNLAIIRNIANMAQKPVWKAGDFFAKTFNGEMEQ
jgi:hypothetical protein